jgi:mycothiol synthase
MTNQSLLAPGLTLRPARLTDVKAVAELTYDVAALEGDTLFVMSAEDLTEAWMEANFQVDRDVFVVETSEGRIVGSEECYSEPHRLKVDGCVHPNYRNMGIGSALLAKVEERVALEETPTDSNHQRSVQTYMNNLDKAGHILLGEHGYSPIRYFWRMEVELKQAPAAGNLPAGVELRPFNSVLHARSVWQADNEVFQDHWGSHEYSFEDWSKRISSAHFDPTLWLVAWDGDQIAGFSQNRIRQGIGWVGTIGVRRPWRSKGLGLSLLTHTFAEFYTRGIVKIGLGVDSANLTGATRLYERAGMHAVSEMALYEKIWRTD